MQLYPRHRKRSVAVTQGNKLLVFVTAGVTMQLHEGSLQMQLFALKYKWCLCVCWTSHQFHFLRDLRKVAAIRPYGVIYRIAHSATLTLDLLTLSDQDDVAMDKLNLAPRCHLPSCLGHSQKQYTGKYTFIFKPLVNFTNT